MIRLSISNIGWTAENDNVVYRLIKECGVLGLEIAPTRIFPEKPYNNLDLVRTWKEEIRSQYGFIIPSMQSIWHGRSEKIFGTDEDRELLISYTKKAINFAEVIGCENLVFGCPGNRSMPDGADIETAVRFFRLIGEYALDHHTVVAMEANPPIYNTNFLNTTMDAIDFVEMVDSKGFLLNLDVGTMIENGEAVAILMGKEHLINHVHVSEPGLKPIQPRELHKQLADYLQSVEYSRFVSIEVGEQEDIGSLKEMMEYVSDVFK